VVAEEWRETRARPTGEHSTRGCHVAGMQLFSFLERLALTRVVRVRMCTVKGYDGLGLLEIQLNP
jgi:hypothetical protein